MFVMNIEYSKLFQIILIFFSFCVRLFASDLFLFNIEHLNDREKILLEQDGKNSSFPIASYMHTYDYSKNA